MSICPRWIRAARTLELIFSKGHGSCEALSTACNFLVNDSDVETTTIGDAMAIKAGSHVCFFLLGKRMSYVASTTKQASQPQTSGETGPPAPPATPRRRASSPPSAAQGYPQHAYAHPGSPTGRTRTPLTLDRSHGTAVEYPVQSSARYPRLPLSRSFPGCPKCRATHRSTSLIFSYCSWKVTG